MLFSKSSLRSLILILTISLVFLNTIKSIEYQQEVFEHTPGKLLFKWTIDETNQEINATLEAKDVKGWLGFGISQNGFMKNSDVILAYADKSDKTVFIDAYANSYGTPTEDTNLGGKSDYKNVEVTYNNDKATLKFTRALKTGDVWDYDIIKGKLLNVIFAYANDYNDFFGRHDNMQSLNLILYPNSEINEEPNPFKRDYIDDKSVLKMRVSFDNSLVPTVETDYFCRIFDIQSEISKATGLPADTSYHAIAFEHDVQHVNQVHHMIIYSCNSLLIDPTKVNQQFSCESMISGCNSPVALYALGANNIILPKEAGFIWGTGGTQYVGLEMHYSNNSAQNLIDNSGFIVYFTNKLRENTAGWMRVGPRLTLLDIPAGKDDVEFSDLCPANCTSEELDDKGINIFATANHGHEILKDIWSTIISPDGKEDDSASYPNYDFNKQYMKRYKEPIVLNKGDSIKTLCKYNSMSRTNTTIGGFKTKEEMCFTFFAYYPIEKGFRACGLSYGENFCVHPEENILKESNVTLNRDNMDFTHSSNPDHLYDIINNNANPININVNNNNNVKISFVLLILSIIILLMI